MAPDEFCTFRVHVRECFSRCDVQEIIQFAWAYHVSLAGVRCSVSGTFQLTNAGVVKLLECCPKLTGLDLKANSRLDGAAVKAVADDRRPEGGRFKSLSLVKHLPTFMSILSV